MRMNHQQFGSGRRAFTLIELLIVVAVMAILTTTMMTYITIPPQETRRAAADMETEAGLDGLFAKLTGDAHNAARLTPAKGNQALILEETAPAASTVYFVDARDRLRRAVVAPSQAAAWAKSGNAPQEVADAGPAVANVSRLEATPIESGRMWRIAVTVATKDPLRPVEAREIELAIGMPK